jgi:hypothetical protein
MEEDEKYFFDLTGYLVLRGVLGADEIQRCNQAIDLHSAELTTRCQKTRSLAFGVPELMGYSGRQELSGMLEWPDPHGELFRQLLVHPEVVFRLNGLIGEGFRLDNGPRFIGAEKGTEGHRLHGGGEPVIWHHSYWQQNGQILSRAVTVFWQLVDSHEGDGGFVIVPGSHKSCFPPPTELCATQAHRDLIHQPLLNAGDVVLFSEAATHGALPWKGETQRRTIFYRYASKGCARRKDLKFEPEQRYGEWTRKLGEHQRALLYGPGVGRELHFPAIQANRRNPE